jgi:hypothetical protein
MHFICIHATDKNLQSSILHTKNLPNIFGAMPFLCCMFGGEATNTNFIVFGFTRSALEPMIYKCTAFEVSMLTITLAMHLFLSIAS